MAEDQATPAFNPAAGAPPELPDYEVLHTMVGTYARGELIPHGTYTEEQLARLIELEAIKPVAPALRQMTGAALTAAIPDSSEEFKEHEQEASLEAAGGSVATDSADIANTDFLAQANLNDEQARGLAERNFTTAESIRGASDHELMSSPGVGPSTVKRLRALAAE